MRLFTGITNCSEIDQAVRSKLSGSLEHVYERVGDRLSVEEAVFTDATAAIRSTRQHPSVFARYFDLVLAVKANDNDLAADLLRQIVEISKKPHAFSIAAYDKDSLGEDFERFGRLLFSEDATENPIKPPSSEVFQAAQHGFEAALDTIEKVDPVVHAEICDLFSLICVACKSDDPNARPIGGVTSLMIWGATFINIDAHQSNRALVEFLLHESTHGLLFGLSIDEPLTRNALQESYNSPLRPDPRPMNGIYHATLVSARVANFNRQWLESGEVAQNERSTLVDSINAWENAFNDGQNVIREHGKLSQLADELLDQADRALSVAA